MSFLRALFTDENRDGGGAWTAAIARFLAGEDDIPVPTASGEPVSETSALGLTTVYACVRIISWALASLPLITYRREGDGKRRAVEHPVFRLLRTAPNPRQTAFDWVSLMATHQLLWGAGISEIEFDAAGTKPVALWPLPPWDVTPVLTKVGDIVYKLRMPDGRDRVLSQDRVLVFKSITTSGYAWLSPIGANRETIAYAKAVNDFGARAFSQGMAPSGFITHPGKLTETSEESLRKSFDQYKGLNNAHKLMLLEAGMTYQKVGLPPEDAQYLESRSWNVAELARIYNVPLHLLQDHEKSTTWGSGLEELNQGFVTFTLLPYMTQWAQELHRGLLLPDDIFVEFLTQALLRGNTKARWDAYVRGRQNGVYSVNEIRAFENMNPISAELGGDDYLVQLNMQKLDGVGQEQEGGSDAGS